MEQTASIREDAALRRSGWNGAKSFATLRRRSLCPRAPTWISLLEQELGSLAHKNISYNPANGKVNGFVRRTPEQVGAALRGIFERFSQAATDWMAELLPQYSQGWQLGSRQFSAAGRGDATPSAQGAERSLAR